MTKIKKIIRTIRDNRTFLISTHVNPDPDALGSELALAGYLRGLGKKVHIVNEAPVLARFYFLPGVDRIKSYEGGMKVGYDAAIVLDCGELERVGKVRRLVPPGKTVINIDHHITNDFFGDLNLVDAKASSTAEVIYALIQEGEGRLTRDVALNLYIGIMTDTGSFRFENTTARAHHIAGDLMRFNFSVKDLYRKVYASIPRADLKQFVKLMSRFEVLFGGKVVCLELSRKTISRFSKQFDLRDAIFQFLRSMRGVEVVVIFTQVGKARTRVNLRSTEKFDVAALASHFRGGGHQRASGCSIEKDMKGARRDLLARLGESLRTKS
ncbi:MAG: bifunctional oligoribonuclease/PAP phosphatase NrnA [Candidatus Omnitrophica bacterium]|nr:bifunctional oligoribonuclease/PAP phosphatase NrnA [Candidatus Omnitrophota bacterium]